MPDNRFSRSDKGILNLTKSIFTELLGLSPDTSLKLFRIIRSQGEYQDMKNSIRGMSAVSHRRLNDAIAMHKQLDEPIQHDRGGEDDLDEPSVSDAEVDFDDESNNVKESFGVFLLRELQYTADDLRDPQKKQEIMRLMRAGDAQAEQMIKRSQREQKQSQRQDVAQEQDPQRVSLMRKKLNLQKQIQQIDKQLGNITDTGEDA